MAVKIKKSELLEAMKMLDVDSPDEYVLVDVEMVTMSLRCSDMSGKLLKVDIYDCEKSQSRPTVTRTETVSW